MLSELAMSRTLALAEEARPLASREIPSCVRRELKNDKYIQAHTNQTDNLSAALRRNLLKTQFNDG